MRYSCVYCGKRNFFKSRAGLERHLAFCSKVPGKTDSRPGSVGLPKRVAELSSYNQRKRTHFQNEDLFGSANEDNGNHGEGPSRHRDYNIIPTEVDISSVSTK
jgi:hypothetical protein